MRLKDISNLTRNKANSQFSLNLKARQLKKMGITPQNLLELKLPKKFKLITNNQKNISTNVKMKHIPVLQEQKNISTKVEMEQKWKGGKK